MRSRTLAYLLFLSASLFGVLAAIPASAQNGGFTIGFGQVPLHQAKDVRFGSVFTSTTGIIVLGCRDGMRISTLKIDGKDRDVFKIIKDGISGQTCRPGTTLYATVEFTPQAIGRAVARLTAEVHAVDRGCEGEYVFAPCTLVGDGFQAKATPKPAPPLTDDEFTVRDVPGIIRHIASETKNTGFDVAANMQDKWFDGPPTSSAVQSREQSLAIDWGLARDSATTYVLRMDWIIDPQNVTDIYGSHDSRVSLAISRLLLRSEILSVDSLQSLISRITSSAQYKRGDKTISFPLHTISGTATEEIDQAERTQTGPVRNLAPPLDPVGMTLGNFNFCAVPIGSATITNNLMTIRVTDVGIYVAKGFRFHLHDGWVPINFLGKWKKPDQVSTYLYKGDGFIPVYEQDYLSWRDKNKHGMDFLIVSDIKRFHLSTPLKSLPYPL